MNLFPALRYLKYSTLSHHKRGHGIHSPFIFDVVSRVFRNKTDPAIVLKIEQIRKRLLSDKRNIEVNDLGSGAGKLKKNSRRVSDIAGKSPVSRKYGKLLSKMAAEFGKTSIIELGTSIGISTMYMASSSEATVYTIEGCHETAGIALDNFREAGITNIRLQEGSFDFVLPGLLKQGIIPGLVFIDGDHRKAPVIKYFNEIEKVAVNDTVIIIDDINYSKEMAEAWNELKHHKRVSATIDVFRMGVIFFREGIVKKNYVIRY
jgi:predicted O-methyltransferase YrrM